MPYGTGTAEDLAQTVAEIEAAGAEALEIPADVRREQDVERMIATTVDRFGASTCWSTTPAYTPVAARPS